MFSLSNIYNVEIEKNDLERVKELVSYYYKIPKKTLDKVKVSYERLPTICKTFVRRVGSYIQLVFYPIGKILGLYDANKKEIYVDKNLSYKDKVKTLLHEYVHAAQDYLGKIYNNSRERIEEEARRVSEYLFKIYSQTSQKLVSSLDYLALV